MTSVVKKLIRALKHKIFAAEFVEPTSGSGVAMPPSFPSAGPVSDDDKCISEHLYQETGQGGSMGKKMRCEKCGKTKWVPW